MAGNGQERPGCLHRQAAVVGRRPTSIKDKCDNPGKNTSVFHPEIQSPDRRESPTCRLATAATLLEIVGLSLPRAPTLLRESMNNHQSTLRGFLRTMAAAASSVAAPAFHPSSVLGKTAASGWDLGPFVKHKEPVLQPTPDSVFTCPIQGTEVRWEKQNTYNPAAAVRGGKVYLLYRADDQSPDLAWGRTCRIGLAHSDDGVHFTRHERPVLYPDNDAWKQYEWENATRNDTNMSASSCSIFPERYSCHQ